MDNITALETEALVIPYPITFIPVNLLLADASYYATLIFKTHNKRDLSMLVRVRVFPKEKECMCMKQCNFGGKQDSYLHLQVLKEHCSG